MSTIEQSLKIEDNPNSPGMEVLSFGVDIPSGMVRKNPTALNELQLGVVGTITLLARKSAMVWFGFGTLAGEENTGSGTEGRVGSATNLSMGPLMVAMPRSKYQGAFSSGEASSSKLVGDESEDSELLASQMASRLSQRLGLPVFVSCSFANAPSSHSIGNEAGMFQQRASALAEKEVWRILRDKLGIGMK